MRVDLHQVSSLADGHLPPGSVGELEGFPVDCRDERRSHPKADEVLLIEGEDVQEGGQQGDRDDQEGVEITLPGGLVAGHKVDEKADYLGTGELED